MYDKSKLIEEGMKLLKFRDDNSEAYTYLENDIVGTTGPFVNDLAGVTLENVLNGMPRDGDQEVLTNVDQFLRPLLQDAIVDSIDNLLRKSKDKFLARDIIRDLKTVSKPAPFNNPNEEIRDGRFLGFRITPKASEGLSIYITALAVQAKEVQTVRVYLYSSDRKKHLHHWDVVVNETFDQVWNDVESKMVSYSKDHSGVTFLLGIFEQSSIHPKPEHLTSNPMSADFFGCCQDAATIKNLKYAKIAPIEIDESYLTFDEVTGEYLLPGDWTGDFDQYSCSTWKSLAFKISVKCDLTQILINHIDILQEAFIYMAASKIMWALFASPVTNVRHEKLRKDYSSFAVKYERAVKGSMNDKGWVKGILDGIALDLSGVDERCLPDGSNDPYIGNLRSRNGR